jgi:hypothetical protein
LGGSPAVVGISEEEARRRLAHHAPYIRLLPRAGTMGTMLSRPVSELVELAPSSSVGEALLFRPTVAMHFCELYDAHVSRVGAAGAYWERAERSMGAEERRMLERARRVLGGVLTWAGFSWALEVLMSRQNVLPLLGEGSQLVALVPLWDLINHAGVGAMTTAWDPATGCVVHRAMRGTPAGGELRMCYGMRSNVELLLYAGFLHRENPFSTVRLELPLAAADAADALAPVRLAVLRTARVAPLLLEDPATGKVVADTRRVPVHLVAGADTDNPLPADALHVAAVAALDRQGLVQLMRNQQQVLRGADGDHSAEHSEHSEDPSSLSSGPWGLVSDDTRQAALRFLLAQLSVARAMYPPPDDAGGEGEEEGAHVFLTFLRDGVRAAHEIRAQEARVLTRAIAWVRSKLQTPSSTSESERTA